MTRNGYCIRPNNNSKGQIAGSLFLCFPITEKAADLMKSEHERG